ncbi:iron chaperone [Leucobacter chromiireducens]|uniref:YdhG-like domain-containing protein n=1 Tax=Leucobacter chromiireducens subsp. solipictus TaxID=398235 RepID=A0ABS1SBD1_9MICO|nr:DUF1801 domain-containing protein [Leucobacter chromiireducens]MBL3677848.1 hypothetical protein [Leucobacter chromiireducens subsp. solipictus]
MTEKPQTIDEYLSRLDPAPRAALERIRQLVTALVPEATETISYGMPTLLVQDRALVYFTASKKHLSFYPSSWAIDELRDQLTGYATTAHAIKFTLDTPLPSELIEALVRVHVREIERGR